jgi:glycosyltransferase involved in cell wall biosynthesis
MSPGVSIIVCCHNSSRLLPPTLESLAGQIVGPGVAWEVIVVDNGSTDGTAETADHLWRSVEAAPMRVVAEPQLGLSHARARGIASARYEYLTFVDDDNWLEPHWVQATFDVFRDHADAGAVGAVIEPEFESLRPPWFDAVANLYATGPSADLVGDITERHVPCGAGLGLRYSALVDTQQKGLRTISVGRRGTSLSAGEDCELIYCLRLAGWRVRVDARLRLRHFLPSRRLTWAYARRLAYWSAHATPERDALVYACKPPRYGVLRSLRRLRESWLWQCANAAGELVRRPGGLAKSLLSSTPDGDSDVLQIDLLRGRLDGLLAAREWYGNRSRQVRGVMARLSQSTSMPVGARPFAEETARG